MRHQYRLTKYNPASRGADGAYLLDEWTSFSDIGRSFAGVALTETEYLRVEADYLISLEEFLTEAGITSLRITGLETQRSGDIPTFIVPGRELNLAECIQFSQLALREQIWGKLVRPGLGYVHFGYDHYVYLGLPRACHAALKNARANGLFAEPMRSPYLRAQPT